MNLGTIGYWVKGICFVLFFRKLFLSDWSMIQYIGLAYTAHRIFFF